MKHLFKSICVILIACIMVSCSSAADSHTNIPPKTKDDTSINLMPPPSDRMIYDFWTLEEFQTWLVSTDGANAPALEEAAQYGDRYCEFVQQLAQGNEPIFVPYLGDDVVSFENAEGFSNISVLTSSWMGRPWIWYYCLIDNVRYIIRVNYLSTEEEEYAFDHSAAELIAYIYPTTPNVGDKNENYDAIYEDATSLSDRTVSVLRYDFAESVGYGDQITFVYDNLLVSIRAYGEFDESWLKDLSFQPLA